jgi:hypothetical protein
MKKNLLFMMLCCPIVLAAQNGVTVSGLAITSGTVTFNVSWKNTNMPSLWSDTVWVFVDYNNKGVMERLPLSPGATLTATSPGGKVIEEPDNNQGVWVAGNARSAGSFSATVKLLTTVKDVAGACVYGSNYPPVGECLSASEVSFTGTPEYKVVLERSNKSTYTVTVGKGESLPIPNGEVALSFTDKTGAPGKLNCIPTTLCTACCYDGSSWVDCYVTTNAVSKNAQWTGKGNTYYPGASSDRNGRANFTAITASTLNYTPASAVGLCKALGDGWYLPAYEELHAMSSGMASGYSNNLPGASILTDGAHWSSTEIYNNSGRYTRPGEDHQVQAVLIFGDGAAMYDFKLVSYYVQCAWRN